MTGSDSERGEGQRTGGGAGDGATQRPATAVVFARWRARAGVSRQRLADLSDVSATYVRTIEAGVDDQGREVVPSAAIMQKLARGLAAAASGPGDDTGREPLEQQIYAELMAAAGYLPAPPAAGSGAEPVPASPASNLARPAGSPSRRVREAAPEAGEHWRYGGPVQRLSLDAPEAGDARMVVLRDPRLHEHVLPLLEHWERLHRDDQALVLGIMAWLHERRQRTHQEESGGL